MEGHSLDDAKATQCTAAGCSAHPSTQLSSTHITTFQSSSAYVATSQSMPPANDTVESIVVNGIIYYAWASIHTSLDWAQYSCTINPKDNNPSPIAFSASHVSATNLDTSPFILDTGAPLSFALPVALKSLLTMPFMSPLPQFILSPFLN